MSDLWLTCVIHDAASGRHVRDFNVRAHDAHGCLEAIVADLGHSWAWPYPLYVCLDRTPEPGCYIGLIRYGRPPTSAFVQLRTWRSHRLRDECDAWWSVREGALDALMPIRRKLGPAARSKRSRRPG
jgi:hypothetical protein